MRPARFALATVVALLLTGCAAAEPPADDQPEPVVETAEPATEEPTPDPAEEPAPERVEDPAVALEQAVTDYTNAYFAGDWDTAYERL